MGKEITNRADDYSQWYIDLVKKADLAENSDVRGCMVIKPYGFSIWEKMQQALDKMFKDTGHSNAYFPLFIPKSFLAKEASHIEGFAKECAIVTHYRLKNAPDGSGIIVDPDAKLEEELIIRPTSETVIWNSYKKWIQSYRDLPILINQWCNVVRWEMRTRLFLRTAEFLWQEGHTAHATAEEAQSETLGMLEVYRRFVEDFLAIPLIVGRKSAAERFPGAVETYSIEGLMGDGRALQCGTSHFLGQNFAKPFEIRYLDDQNQMQFVWQTSWGVSTRLLGAIVMAHGDDQGLRLPPTVASTQAVIVPIFRKPEEGATVLAAARTALEALTQAGIRARIDEREGMTPGFKFNDWEMRGVPVRIEIGPRDVASGEAVLARRDKSGPEAKSKASLATIASTVSALLGEIQTSLYAQAKAAMVANTRKFDDYAAFRKHMEGEGGGGFADVFWCGNPVCETRIREETKATCRAFPLTNDGGAGKFLVCGEPAAERAYFAKSY